MKTLVATTTLFLLVMLCGCGTSSSGSSSQTVSGIPVARHWRGDSSETPALTPLDKEATEQAIPSWKLTKIGDSHYFSRVRGYSEKPEHWFAGRAPNLSNVPKSKAVCELRQVCVKVDPDGLTDADKLNGIEWRGKVLLWAGARRWYVLAMLPRYYLGKFESPEAPDKTWGKWFNGNWIFGATLKKTNGKWAISSPQSLLLAENVDARYNLIETTDDAFERVDQSELPK